ncbi:ATP synthase F1 subunit delta [Halanaerobium sp. Z-7514]|uniref:ATP synthase subunit delta n=1 Tax=Halanaerobium polyolivorans TaxID=2886943 RepID=A0AAW4WYU7_9FIRM|nr:ATP synthase F1 subunit delta [Halanaerobium polyolivorans]MCC3144887.1 ATP synthase F1 subunit delta [Halanaerobium polyolivorans]
MINEAANRYSRGLFALGKERERLIDFKETLEEFWQVLEENEDLRNVVFHQRILPKEKKRVMEKIFTDELNQDVLNFLYILIEKRREYHLKSIINEFKQLVDQEEKILDVEVTSAVELNEKLKEKLQAKLDQILDYNIRIFNVVDQSIIAGLKIKVGDYIIDGSLLYDLKRLQQKIESIPVSKLGVN